MSKRSRGPGRPSHRRPGARPPTARSARPSRPSAGRPEASQLEAATEIAEDVVDGRADEVQAETERVGRATYQRHRVKAGSALAARAATEYLYVGSDLRRIVALSSVLFAVLLGLWLLIVVLRVIPLDFY